MEEGAQHQLCITQTVSHTHAILVTPRHQGTSTETARQPEPFLEHCQSVQVGILFFSLRDSLDSCGILDKMGRHLFESNRYFESTVTLHRKTNYNLLLLKFLFQPYS